MKEKLKEEPWLDIAGAILDGSPIGWDTVPETGTEGDRTALDEFRLLADIAAAHRTPSFASHSVWGGLQLLAPIGRGTFGEVYRAHDPALDREVAVKLLRPPASGKAEEGKLLARVRHPNIVTVYGAGYHDGAYGIWMEFVRGRTLAEVVAHDGRLAPGEVVNIGIDVCRALAAVHGAGLLHGDVKPQNVMREPDGRIVLMDFGTGRLAADQSDPSALAGTPLYLAPEVLGGQQPDARADIYAVGVLLYYLLTAAAPVEGQTLADVRAAHAGGRRVRVRDRRPDVPRRIATIIDRATSSDPAERFESAVAFEAALAQAAPSKTSTGLLSRRFAIAATLLLATAIGFGWWQWTGVGRAPSAPRWVLVGAFENHTGDPRLDDVVQFAFEQELAQSHALTVVAPERVADTLGLMKRPPTTRLDAAIAREVCLRDGGIPIFTAGRIDHVGKNYAVNVTVNDARNGAAILRAGVDAPDMDGMLEAVRRLARNVRTGAGEDATQVEADAQLEKVTTGSLAALQQYTRGVALVNERRWAAAELPLRDAVRLDPAFASAHIMLAHCLHNQRRSQEEYLATANRALELAETLPNRERLFVAGSYYGMAGDNFRAAAAYEALMREYPDDFWAVNNLVIAYKQTGRSSEAAPLMVRLASIRPNDPTAIRVAAEAMVLQGNLAGARPLVARAVAVLGSNGVAVDDAAAWLKLFPVFELWADGRSAEAAAQLDAIAAASGATSALEQGIGLMNLALGRVRKAEDAFRAMAIADEPFEFLALAKLARGDVDGARQALLADPRLAHMIDRPPAGPSPMDVWLLRRFGLVDEAEALSKQSELPDDTRIMVLAARAEVLAARGSTQAAVALLERVQDLSPLANPVALRSLDSLAELRIARGELESAEARLKRTDNGQRRMYLTSGSSGYYWLCARTWLLRIERRLGHADRAAQIEQELRQFLAVADPEFVLLRELN